MKILYVVTVARTMNFFSAHIQMLQEEGNTVELAANFSDQERGLRLPMLERNCVQHHIPFSRSPFSKDNLAAYRALKKLLAQNHYDIVHTHTPNASALVRLACRKLRKSGTRVFYTAHGFHFYTGAPLKNWLIYYPVERFLSRWTDVLITMNQEDYRRAQTFHAGRVELVHGVGIDGETFDLHWTLEQKAAKRGEFGVAEDEYMLLSVGELSHRKNHETVIQAVAELRDLPIRYFICGYGALREHLEHSICELGLEDRVKLLGSRHDIGALNQAADIFVLPSFHEGLPVALMESMAAGNPAVCSDIRGNVDLIAAGAGGILCDVDCPNQFAEAIRKLIAQPELRQQMGQYNKQAVQAFSTEKVLEEMKSIIMGEME